MARTYKRKFTMRSPEEKEAIILEYFNDHHASYRKTADKYGVDYSRFRRWIKKYQEEGYNCAVGYAYCEHKDKSCMNELFKIAENNMYKDKEKFYKESKAERRKA